MTLTIFTFSFQVPRPLGRNLSPSQVLNSKERGFQWEPHLSTRKGILRTVEGEGGFSLQTCSPMKVKVLVIQSCLTLCNPMDCSLSGPSVHGILQPRTLEWVAMPFSSGSSWPRDQTQVSCIADRFFTVWATRDILSHPAYVQPLNLARFIFVEEGGNQNTTEYDSWLWRSAVS